MDRELAEWPNNRIFNSFCAYCERLTLFDMLNDAIVIATAESGAVLFMNERACHMYGYSLDEAKRLALADLAAPGLGLALAEIVAAGAAGVVFTAVRRRKDGELFTVGVSARQLRLHGTEVVALIERDVTPDLAAREELALAGKVQRSMLPPDFANHWVAAEGIFQPHRHVSGDFYDYRWFEDERVLCGYVADVMGHGLATALQTSALRVLLGRALDKGGLPGRQLTWANALAADCCADDAFAAAIMFAVDFDKGLLRFASAGINHFIVCRDGVYSVERAPGLFLGIDPAEEFAEYSVPLTAGSGFVFLSDGLFELLPAGAGAFPPWSRMALWLRALAGGTGRRDDAAALCISIL